jgi:DNA-binding response OmpR family regulator
MRVLVVEDEIKMASLIRRGLGKEGIAADVAIKGEDALWMAEATEYDAIVLDVMLPGIDGFEVCRRLRGEGIWAPILMLTARDAVRDRVAGLDGGADDYLTKPFSYAELLARLRALVRRGPDRPSSRLAICVSIPRLGGFGAATTRSRSRRRSSRSSTRSCDGPARCSRASRSSSTPGTTTTRTARTWSTPTFAFCDASWTSRSG